jgi:hypothetical protein
MLGYNEVREMTAGLIGNYDQRICAVEEIIGKSLQMMGQYQDVEKAVQSQLKETLAKKKSLRKRDFDMLISPIIEYQGKREKEIKEFLNFFLKTQRQLAGELRMLIERGILTKVPDFEKAIQKSIEDAKMFLINFQKAQVLIGGKMQSMFQKKEELTLKDFKETLSVLLGELGLKKN